MRGRGIPTMRRNANGLFWPGRVYFSGARLADRPMLDARCVMSLRGAGVGPASEKWLTQRCRGEGMSVDEEAVRQLAQLIWETEGRPQGQEDRHWEMATKLAESAAMAPTKGPYRPSVDTLFPEPDLDGGPEGEVGR